MAERLTFDTSFLIDFQRERTRAEDGPAHAFLRANKEAVLCLSSVALGEFAEGFATADHPLVDLVRTAHELVPVDEAIALEYGRLTRRLRSEGRLIGTNDLWIAATALRHGLPLVADNARHFGRVDGLDLRSYR